MAKEVYRNRLIDSVIKKYLSLFKAVCIEGPKASGKTWAAKQCAKSEIMIGDPSDSFANRRLASLDVMAALRGEGSLPGVSPYPLYLKGNLKAVLIADRFF